MAEPSTNAFNIDTMQKPLFASVSQNKKFGIVGDLKQ